MTVKPKKFYGRCGLCCTDFATRSRMLKHFKSELHLRRLARWYELEAKDKQEGKMWDMKGDAKKVLAEETRPEVVNFD